MRGVPSSWLLGAAFMAGAGTMAIELSAVRLIAPWFGTSQAVWTSAIGAVLLALCAGYLVGGRWAGSAHPERPLAVSLWLAAAWAVCLPSLAPWVANALVPSGVNIEQVANSLPISSLACSLVLFFPPAALLATAGPLVVELIVRSTGCSAGSAGGRVLASSTAGSLLGTFGTTYFGVPVLGISGTLWLTAGLIALGALLTGRSGRHRMGAVLVLGASLISTGGSSNPEEGLIAVEESPYQRVRVVERADGWRALEVNERRGSFQSIWSPTPGLLGPGYYYDYFALPAAWGQAEEEWGVLILGLGAGTAWRVVEGSLQGKVQVSGLGVELDPVVVSLSQAHMELPTDSKSLRILSGWDARAALRPLYREGGRWDQVVVDVYANQVEIPPHLATLEFFDQLKPVLREGGWVQVNVGAAGCDDPLVVALGATLAGSFGAPTLALEVPFSRNVVLVQRLNQALVTPNDAAFLPDAGPLRVLAQRALIHGTWALVGTDDASHLRDHHAPLEALQRESLRRLDGQS